MMLLQSSLLLTMTQCPKGEMCHIANKYGTDTPNSGLSDAPTGAPDSALWVLFDICYV